MKDLMLSPISISDLEELIRKCVNEVFTTQRENKTYKEETDEELLTADEAAHFLKVSLVSIHNWKREKGLPYYRLGRSIRFKKSELIEFARLKR